MESLLATVLADSSHKIFSQITEIATDMECYVSHAYGRRYQKHIAFTLLLTGNWNNIAKIETALKNLAHKSQCQIMFQRATKESSNNQALSYSVQIIALDQVGTVYNICEFFSSRSIDIESLETESYDTQRHASMLSISLSISIPTTCNIAELREEFLLYCEELNVDGILEPERR